MSKAGDDMAEADQLFDPEDQELEQDYEDEEEN